MDKKNTRMHKSIEPTLESLSIYITFGSDCQAEPGQEQGNRIKIEHFE